MKFAAVIILTLALVWGVQSGAILQVVSSHHGWNDHDDGQWHGDGHGAWSGHDDGQWHGDAHSAWSGHGDGTWSGAHGGDYSGSYDDHDDGQWRGDGHGAWSGHDDGQWHGDAHGAWNGAHAGSWHGSAALLVAAPHWAAPAHGHAAAILAPAHGHGHEGHYLAKNRGAVHSAPLAGHAKSAASINVAPAPGTV